jgi:hypothetical protein
MTRETSIQMFLSEMQHHVATIDNSLSSQNSYLIGYRQCLINTIKLVKEVMLDDEMHQIIDAYESALNIEDPLFYDINNGKEYYHTIYKTINTEKLITI